jgi:hypothetical protein
MASWNRRGGGGRRGLAEFEIVTAWCRGARGLAHRIGMGSALMLRGQITAKLPIW